MMGVGEEGLDLSELEISIEGDSHRSILGIQDQIRVPEFRGSGIEPTLVVQGYPHRGAPDVAGHTLDGVT